FFFFRGCECGGVAAADTPDRVMTATATATASTKKKKMGMIKDDGEAEAEAAWLTVIGEVVQGSRLPRDVRPRHYALRLTPDLVKFTFSGTARIDIEASARVFFSFFCKGPHYGAEGGTAGYVCACFFLAEWDGGGLILAR